MKISFWDFLTGILMFAGFGVVLVFANIFIDPYTILNPFPPPTLQPTLQVPTITPTQRELPDIWTVTPTGNVETTTLLPSLTPVSTSTGFVLPTGTTTGTNTPIPSLTPVGPTRTNTPPGGKTSTPTRTRTPTASSFSVTSVQNISISPSSWNGTCPKNFTFSADIYYTRDGVVTYYWIRSSDNAHLGSGTLDLDGSSPDRLSKVISLGSAGYVNTSTYYLYIDNPNHQRFGGKSLPITCTGLTITSNGGGATAAINVAENTTAVTTVTSNLGGTIYSLTGGADASLFTINATTGVLTFTAPRDFEAPADSDLNNTYVVNVHAVNGSYTDDQLITVTVTNVNDNAPVITSNGGGDTATISFAENSTAAVTTVTATDADAGATRTFSKAGGADTALFAINASSGVLTFVTPPNYEGAGDNSYEVIVQVSDGTFTDTQTITVNVTDVNEPPVITSDGGAATVNKSVNENDTAVADVDATDPEGVAPVYSISGADAGAFSIDAGTGVLTFDPAPDYENPTDAGTNNVYNVTVTVTDGTTPVTQAFVVTVNPVNDNDPTITSGSSFSVVQGTTAVTTVSATDSDLPAQTLTFSITGGADQALFNINANSGALTFNPAPVYNSGGDNDYEVTVQVSDGTRTDSVTIAVTVTET